MYKCYSQCCSHQIKDISGITKIMKKGVCSKIKIAVVVLQ